MKELNSYLLENLLNDTSFKNWVTKSNRNDVVFWNNWIINNPEQIDVVYNARDIITGIQFKKNELDEDFVKGKLDEVLSRINTRTLEKSLVPSKAKKTSPIWLAASLMAAMVLFLIAFNIYTASNEVIHETAYGENIHLKLPDGTTVVLNGNSELKYKKDNPRNVYLKGEAYFKVKSKPSTHAKFWVNTEDLKVEVFGTQFNVNTRDKRTNVLLDEGSISLLFDNGDSKQMKPGELVSYSKDEEKVLAAKVSPKLKYALWREGTYIFNNLTLEEVMKNIEHSYGVSSEFSNDELKSIIISGGIPNENLKICLSAIEKSTGTRIILKNNRLLILTN